MIRIIKKDHEDNFIIPHTWIKISFPAYIKLVVLNMIKFIMTNKNRPRKISWIVFELQFLFINEILFQFHKLIFKKLFTFNMKYAYFDSIIDGLETIDNLEKIIVQDGKHKVNMIDYLVCVSEEGYY